MPWISSLSSHNDVGAGLCHPFVVSPQDQNHLIDLILDFDPSALSFDTYTKVS